MIAVVRILNKTPAEVTDVPVCRKYFINEDLILQVIVMCGICVRSRYTSLESILSGKSGGLHLFDECMLLPF